MIFDHLNTIPPTPPTDRENSTPLNQDTNEDTLVVQNNNLPQQQLVASSTTAPQTQPQQQLPPIPEHDSNTSHQQSVPATNTNATSNASGTTRHQSKFPWRGSTPTASHQKWNSAWKHKSNPNYSMKNKAKASTVENPYTSTRPPTQVQFANPTATPIGPTASSTSNFATTQGFVPVSSSANPPPQFTPSQQQYQQQMPSSSQTQQQHQMPLFH